MQRKIKTLRRIFADIRSLERALTLLGYILGEGSSLRTLCPQLPYVAASPSSLQTHRSKDTASISLIARVASNHHPTPASHFTHFYFSIETFSSRYFPFHMWISTSGLYFFFFPKWRWKFNGEPINRALWLFTCPGSSQFCLHSATGLPSSHTYTPWLYYTKHNLPGLR